MGMGYELEYRKFVANGKSDDKNVKEVLRLNRIYKVVFNQAKGQYEVVSELARNKGKSSQPKLLRMIIKNGGVN